MGVTAALYSWGFQYENPKKPYEMEGFVNSKAAVEALEFYKSLYDCCTPPGYTDSYMQEGLDAFKSGQVAMMMNWFAFFPGLYKDPDVGGDKIGFFVNPKAEGRGLARWAARASRWSATREKQDEALAVHQVVRPARRAEEVVVAGRLLLLTRRCCSTRASRPRAPFAADFLKAMSGVKDFWQEPAYASLMLSMQKRVHDYVVAGQGTAQEAADAMVKDWTEVFEDEGKL